MTAHDHRTYVEGCYRCELSRDEVGAACPRCGSTNPAIYISEWDGQAWPMTRPPGCPNEWHDQ